MENKKSLRETRSVESYLQSVKSSKLVSAYKMLISDNSHMTKLIHQFQEEIQRRNLRLQ